MHGILLMNTLSSVNIMTFVRSCHKMALHFINMSQMPSISVQLFQIDTKLYTCKVRMYDIEFFPKRASCAHWACIGGLLTNFAQQVILLSVSF